jgi:hypothetical protein
MLFVHCIQRLDWIQPKLSLLVGLRIAGSLNRLMIFAALFFIFDLT